MITPWGESLDPDNPLPEYPRPQLVRDSHLSLNGRWDHAFTSAEQVAVPAVWDGEIIVPFSPEAPLSGVHRVLQPDEALWYRRSLVIHAGFTRDRVLLHFGAVDQDCEVLIDGEAVGSHRGGYLPFSIDITAFADGAEHELVVRVRDVTDTSWRSRGKQRLKPGGIWYTPQSGIWQSVWVESVPSRWVDRLVLTPDLQRGEVEVTVVDGSGAGGTAHVVVRADGRELAAQDVESGRTTRLALGQDVRRWSPEDPFLHDVEVRLGDDVVTSYFGMRSFGMGPDTTGRTRLLLNGEPYLHAGLLDQGYWPDGLYTAPSDEAFIHDIQTAKDLGFTMLRKHIKIEPLRWYYHCDRHGMLVWQDAVNGGAAYEPLWVTAPVFGIPHRRDLTKKGSGRRGLGRTDAAGQAAFEAELTAMIEHLRNVVSLSLWVPFNEGWGQFDAARIADRVRELDPTRPVDHASGWHDQGAGDLQSLHVYFRKFRVPTLDSRVLALTEYGGYSHAVPGHVWGAKRFGYKRLRSLAALETAYRKLHEEQIAPAIEAGLAAVVYTQLSDVEDEDNGLITYDRRIEKIPADIVARINDNLRAVFTRTKSRPKELP